VDIVLYSVLGATVYLIAWIVPGLFIKSPLVRVPAQVVTVVIAAFFLPMPKDTKVAYLAGQYAFVGGVVLVGLWSMIQKLRKS
jgi:hypothetical protein